MHVLLVFIVYVQAYMIFADNCPPDICPHNEICCPRRSPGDFGCCPEFNICCSDGLHCCPANTICNFSKGTTTCVDKKEQPTLNIFHKPETKFIAPSLQKVKKVKVVYCPSGSTCPDGNTCCLLVSGQYGCCPYPSATCCNDKIHCCPYGSKCDPTSQYCFQAGSNLPVAFKKPHIPSLFL